MSSAINVMMKRVGGDEEGVNCSSTYNYSTLQDNIIINNLVNSHTLDTFGT